MLDIGCGTGILSIFAARAGAKHVYAIENAEIAHFAREIIKRNGLEDKITVIKGKMEEIELPVKQVDIIVSEWMGYFLFYESMLDSVLWARDKYLAKGGKMVPDRVQMYIAAIEDGQYKGQKRNFWNDVYGVNMSCMAPSVIREPLVDIVSQNAIISTPSKILQIDLTKMKPGDVEFSVEYQLKAQHSDRVHGIVAWFDCEFYDFQRRVTLTTSPYCKPTHWKQTVFYTTKDFDVNRDDIISGSIACRKSHTNFRELDIKVSYHHKPSNTDIVNMYKLR